MFTYLAARVLFGFTLSFRDRTIMSRVPSSFVARLALLALPLLTLTYTVNGAHLAIQPPISAASTDRETRPPSRSLPQARGMDTRGLLLPNSCSASRYECPTDNGGSLSETSMLLQCSISQEGKLQCVYGDLTGSDKVDRVLGGAVGSGESASGLGSDVTPSTDICTYDLVSAPLGPFFVRLLRYSDPCDPSLTFNFHDLTFL